MILLCTHWHDARVVYNESIRKLSDKWGFPLVKFDEQIGFSKTVEHPETHRQTSTLFADDTECIDGVEYGWLPTGVKTVIFKTVWLLFLYPNTILSSVRK